MSRLRKTELTGPIAELRARAKAFEESTVSESVLIDAKTYERLVNFAEKEGCAFREGLRRALKIGVEALMLEHERPWEAAQRDGHGYGDPTDQAIGRSSSAFVFGREIDHEPNRDYSNVTPLSAPFTDDVREDTKYAVTAPPGI